MAAVNDERALAIAASRGAWWFWRGVRRLLRMTVHPWLRVDVSGVEHLRVDGPLLIAPVHRSNLDAPIIGAMGDRPFRYLAKRSLFANGLFGWMVSALGGFPVDRGTADRDSLAAAQAILAEGHALLVFPEGTRQPVGDVGELFEGVVFLAARTNAPIVPVGISGTGEALGSGRKVPRRTKVNVVVAEPLRLEVPDGERLGRSARREANAELTRRLQGALDAANAVAGAQ